MAKKNEEIKENEEVKENVVVETTETTENEVVNSDGDVKTDELSVEAPKQENVEKEAKAPTVKEVFRDKYDSNIIYKVGDIFVESEDLTDKKPVKVKDGEYKVSKERYEELKRSLYVD
jgi:hypothetical protein